MKFLPIFFVLLAVVCLAVAAGFQYLPLSSHPKQEVHGGICNSQKTPTKLIARRTWPSQTATTAKPTTIKTTSSNEHDWIALQT
ncbi:hypothetical protein DAPPUDRAFT_253489 [Daphnia pulex]|uniref:Uncharacterized protein n=1 Tax=Daphnia pulex TaxID=6669 RepID=E9H4Y5_DAPPU|nr:hypothetical protein DAPPUDRAFT_253489 [Daphnia pulex]|eukprot:EFX73225.1 hypothetical protein DAPPUDRAFT_253489 [Daphnia pulex]